MQFIQTADEANANRYPDQVAYLSAWVASSPQFLATVNAPKNQETPVSDFFRSLSTAAVAFLNGMSAEDADMLQDEDAARFEDEFFAAHQA